MDRADERLQSLSDDALHQLGDAVPEAWLDGMLGTGDLQALVGSEEVVDLDAAGLDELLTGLDAEAETRVAAAVVDDFLGGVSRSATASESPEGGAMPGFLDEDRPRAEVISLHRGVGEEPRASSTRRPWWSAALPLVAAAVVLLVLLDGPGLGAVFDDEGRVRPAEFSPNATASAESGSTRAKWSLAEVPVPGSVAERSGAGDVEESEEEATIAVPGAASGGAPGAVKGGVAGGVVGGVLGGSLGGAPGGVVGGVAREPGEGPAGSAVGSILDKTSPNKGSPTRRPTVMAIDTVMGHSLYAPDPDPKALAGTKAGMFDRRPCDARIRFCVDAQGRSVDVRSVGSCYDPKVNQICRDTVKKWRFKPFIVGGEASPVCTEVKFDLRFDKRR